MKKAISSEFRIAFNVFLNFAEHCIKYGMQSKYSLIHLLPDRSLVEFKILFKCKCEDDRMEKKKTTSE